MSKKDRVKAFMSDLDSNNWGSLYTHIHPDNPNRSALRDAQTWNPDPVADNSTFDDSNYRMSGETVTINVESSQDTYNGDWEFSMKEDTAGLWYIDGITGPNGENFLAN
jgi:hypothetical protein